VVNFETQRITPVFVNSTILTFVVPSTISPYCPSGSMCAMYVRLVTPGNYSVTVADGNSTSNSLTFSVTDSSSSLSLTSVNPTAGPIGTLVTLKGSGFMQEDSVNFGNGFLYPTFHDSNTLTFAIPSNILGGCRSPMMCPNYTIPVNPGTYNISVYRWQSGAAVTSNSVSFTVTSGSLHQPIINSISGPTNLSVNQTGTWSIMASDPDNGALTYSINWGDQTSFASSQGSLSPNYTTSQQATFTHVYSNAGTYTVQVTVTNALGNMTNASISVAVH